MGWGTKAVGDIVSYISVALIKHPTEATQRRKGLFWLTVPAGKSITAGGRAAGHQSKTQRDHILNRKQRVEQTRGARKDPLKLHMSFSKVVAFLAFPKQHHHLGLKYLSPWLAFLVYHHSFFS